MDDKGGERKSDLVLVAMKRVKVVVPSGKGPVPEWTMKGGGGENKQFSTSGVEKSRSRCHFG